jgi:hypothetical protein
MRMIEVASAPEFPPSSRARTPRAERPEEAEAAAGHESWLRSVLRWHRGGGAEEPGAPEVEAPRRESPFPFC